MINLELWSAALSKEYINLTSKSHFVRICNTWNIIRFYFLRLVLYSFEYIDTLTSLINGHSLIVALIKSPWWKMLCYLCLFNKINCQIALCNSLLWVNEIIVYHLPIVDMNDAKLTNFYRALFFINARLLFSRNELHPTHWFSCM